MNTLHTLMSPYPMARMSKNETGRKIIAALQVSVDGFIEGPNGELDWAMAEDEE
jgi:hypothetical protein